jgi:hypothetical protein
MFGIRVELACTSRRNNGGLVAKHGKPTGDIPFVRVGGGQVEELRVDLPSSKPEIEDWILTRTLRSADREGVPLFGGFRPDQNPEDDFDYTIQTPYGIQYLDLMEVFVGTTGPHSSAPAAFDGRKRAEEIADAVMNKSESYGQPARPLHLLLYSTDWRLSLHPPVAEILAVALSTRPHVFETIVYFGPLDGDGGFVFRMWPLTGEVLAEYERCAQSVSQVILLDLKAAEIGEDGVSLSLDLTRLLKP